MIKPWMTTLCKLHGQCAYNV